MARGDADAQFNYGVCLLNGRGVRQNYEEAARYFKLSADQGNADGQFAYGICLKKGLGVRRDRQEAKRYFKLCGKYP